jgi:predicted amidohydrolase
LSVGERFKGLVVGWRLVGFVTGRQDRQPVLPVDSSGTIQARFDKIHMFDVDLESGESYRESATYQPGTEAVLADTPWGGLGMTICYDLRFPQLYRDLAKAGAQMLAVPSAFTRPTGEAHWEVLLRARAIENAAYVFAPAQCGQHPHGRLTHGHSLIVDPWGTVLADGGDAPGCVVAEIDPAKVDEVRRSLPSLTHDRSYQGF